MQQVDEVPGSNEIFGPPAPPFTSRHALAFLAYLGLFGWLVFWQRHPDYFLLIYLAITAWSLVKKFRRPTFVSTAGVVRPWRRRSFLRWDEIESVTRPAPGSYGVRLNLVGGKTVALEDIPAAESAEVAAIGHKQLVSPAMIGARSERVVVRSDVQIEADVRRQAAALAEQRKVLKAQSDALHWKP